MNLGFVGLGAMGQLIVPRLMAAGHKVVGWNRSRDKAEALIKKGMGWADTPRAVAAQSDIVFSIVTDSRAVKACPAPISRRSNRSPERRSERRCRPPAIRT